MDNSNKPQKGDLVDLQQGTWRIISIKAKSIKVRLCNSTFSFPEEKTISGKEILRIYKHERNLKNK